MHVQQCSFIRDAGTKYWGSLLHMVCPNIILMTVNRLIQTRHGELAVDIRLRWFKHILFHLT